MAKFYGVVGYVVTEEIRPGVWDGIVTEKPYKGDVIENNSRWSNSSETTNDEVAMNDKISIVANPYAYQNFLHIKYVKYMGVKWKVTNVNVQRPRLILTLGGVYNG